MGREHQSRKLFGKLFAPWVPPWLPVNNHILSYLKPLSKCLLLVKVSHTLEFSSPAFLVNLELPYMSRFKNIRLNIIFLYVSIIHSFSVYWAPPVCQVQYPSLSSEKQRHCLCPHSSHSSEEKHEEWFLNFNDFFKNVVCFPTVLLTLTQKSKSLSMLFCWLVFNGLPLNSIPERLRKTRFHLLLLQAISASLTKDPF